MADSTSPRILASAIDWLTVTARPDERADELARLAGAVLVEERDAGNRQKPWHWNGYAGLTAGGIAYGTRRDGTIARLSGHTAARWACPASQLASNVTRADLQVTWVDAHADADAAVMRLYHNRADISGRGGRADRTIIRPERTGPTLYAGRRSSDQFGRIYDKHSEEPEAYPAGAVRAEVEVKGDAARALGARIGDGSVTGSYVLAYTRDWFSRRGVSLPLPPGGSAELDVPPRAPTDASRTLRWLAKQVAPGVARAVDWVGLAPTLIALGLDGYIEKEHGLCVR
jgi:DNA relaxase NicK